MLFSGNYLTKRARSDEWLKGRLGHDTLIWPPGLRNHKTHNRTVTIANISGVQNAVSAWSACFRLGRRWQSAALAVFSAFLTCLKQLNGAIHRSSSSQTPVIYAATTSHRARRNRVYDTTAGNSSAYNVYFSPGRRYD